MIEAKVGNRSGSEKEFINEMERIGNYEEFECFFGTEEKLLNHLYNLEKAEAQQAVRKMIGFVSRCSEVERLKGIKYYFITLSSIVSRYLERNHLSSSKAFAFNVTCLKLIEQKLTNENAVELAEDLIEFYSYVLTDREPPSLPHDTVNNVILHINEEVEAPLTVEGIAQKFDVSTSHLSRIFREHSGVTLIEYINIRKVEESQYYLRFSGKKISAISEQFHFCNQSYFTRIFKKYTGETPRRFRHNLTGDYFRFTLPEKENQLTDEE